MVTKLFFSAKESEALRLKVGRGKNVLSSEDITNLKEEIFENAYDICRLRVEGNNQDLFTALSKTGFPYGLFSINYLNKISISTIKPLATDVRIVECLPHEMPDLRKMIEEILDTKGWIEYRSDWYDNFISGENHKELALDYFTSFHHEGIEGGQTWRLIYKGENAGIFMGKKNGDIFNGTFYGILPAFRNSGLAGQIYIAMLNICHEIGCTFFENEVGIFNIPSMKATLSSKLLPEKIFFNIILFPLLTEVKKGVIAIDRDNKTSASRLIQDVGNENIHELHYANRPGYRLNLQSKEFLRYHLKSGSIDFDIVISRDAHGISDAAYSVSR